MVLLTFAFSAFAAMVLVFLWDLYGQRLRATTLEVVSGMQSKRGGGVASTQRV